jgi:hypothetical protein
MDIDCLKLNDLIVMIFEIFDKRKIVVYIERSNK